MTSDARHFEDRALDDLAFRDVAEAVIVKVQEARVFLRIDLIVHLGETRCLLGGSGRAPPCDGLIFGLSACGMLSGSSSNVLAGISAPAGCRCADRLSCDKQ